MFLFSYLNGVYGMGRYIFNDSFYKTYTQIKKGPRRDA